MNELTDLTAAAKAYVQRLESIVLAECDNSSSQVFQTGIPRWVADPIEQGDVRRRFSLRTGTSTAFEFCALQQAVRMPELQEHKDLAAALQRHPVIGSRLDHLVGTALLGMMTWSVEQLIANFGLAATRKSPDQRLSDLAFHDVFEAWVTELTQSELTVTTVAPLIGVSGDGIPVRLTPALTIELMSEDEVSNGLGTGILRFPMMSQGFVSVDPISALRMTRRIPVLVGAETDLAGSAQELREDERSSAENARLTLRLFREGHVFIPGIFSYVSSPFGGNWTSFVPWDVHDRRFHRDSYPISTIDAGELPAFYKQVVAARGNKAIDAAVRRFGYAGDRNRPDDQVVDLVISAESLFLAEIGPPQERGETTYRFSLRAASFVEVPGASRRQILRAMRRAYNARSAIVHGGSLDPSELRSLDGRVIPESKFAELVEELVRAALRKAVTLTANRAPFPPDWDDLILGSV